MKKTYRISDELIGSRVIGIVVLGKGRDGERHCELSDAVSDANMRREMGRHTAQESNNTGDLHLERIFGKICAKEYIKVIRFRCVNLHRRIE